MGDLAMNSEIFKQLGFDSSNQWIFYDKRFEKFFNFFAENINVDVNLMTEHEVLERDVLLRRGEFLDAVERQKRLQNIEHDNAGLLECTEPEVSYLEQDISALQCAEEAYAELLADMRLTNNKTNPRLGELEDNLNIELGAQKDLLALCQNKCKKLEELQRENLKLTHEATNCFTITQSPPLFMHELALDQYFLKCDSFMEYLTLYMNCNFKMQENNGEQHESATHEIVASLDSLAILMENYTHKYIKSKVKVKATQTLIDMLDLRYINVCSLPEMEAEIRQLELLNEHHLKSTYDIHVNDLMRVVQQRTHQRMELVLYENTKLKFERAQKRHDDVKCLTKLISDALANADLIWIAIQLDLEKKQNRFSSMDKLCIETKTCLKRVKAMQQLNGTKSGMCNVFVHDMAQLLNEHMDRPSVRNDVKSCLYEYEKLCRLLAYAEQGIWNKKPFALAQEQLDELSRVEQILKQLVYDSPVKAPMLVQLRFLQDIFEAKTNQQRIEIRFRQLRSQFQENITERMENDKLWRYRQLLWMWFLTEPKRMLQAIQEVEKIAAKVPAISQIKALGGIRRK